MNKKDLPDTPPDSPLLFPPPFHVMKPTYCRKVYSNITRKRVQHRKRAKSCYNKRNWVPAKSFQPILPVALPPVAKKRIYMPRYIENTYEKSTVREMTPEAVK